MNIERDLSKNEIKFLQEEYEETTKNLIDYSTKISLCFDMIYEMSKPSPLFIMEVIDIDEGGK